MKYFLNITLLCTVLLLTGCSSKELKQYGGNLALNGGANPVMALSGAVVGGSIYAVGSLMEDNQDNGKETNENE